MDTKEEFQCMIDERAAEIGYSEALSEFFLFAGVSYNKTGGEKAKQAFEFAQKLMLENLGEA